MSKIKIVAIGGDFIGPEAVNEGIKVLNQIETIYNLNFKILELGGTKKTKEVGSAVCKKLKIDDY